ncbi:MAG: hypothetical protein Q7U75_10830, partial [Desulfobacterales bacterium]|nr:hypothetical protein [Desulfobacterales bacterium]
EILLQTLLEERDSVEEDRRIAERLRIWPDQGRIIEMVLQFIEKYPDSLAIERLMDYLAENMDARVAERLLKLDSDSLELDQKLAVVASRLGAPLLDLLPAVIESQNPAGIIRTLSVMPTVLQREKNRGCPSDSTKKPFRSTCGRIQK